MKGGEDGGRECLQETRENQKQQIQIQFAFSFIIDSFPDVFFWIDPWIHLVFKMLNYSDKIAVRNLLKLLCHLFLMDQNLKFSNFIS